MAIPFSYMHEGTYHTQEIKLGCSVEHEGGGGGGGGALAHPVVTAWEGILLSEISKHLKVSPLPCLQSH